MSKLGQLQRTRWGAWLPGVVVVMAVALLPLFRPPLDATMSDFIQALALVVMALGLNIVVGFAGLLDLGYVAFYALGAYTYALLATTFGLSFWICLPLAGTLAAFWGILLGFPVLRLRGDYLAIVTLAFGEIVPGVIWHLPYWTGGPRGISGVPPLRLGPWGPESPLRPIS